MPGPTRRTLTDDDDTAPASHGGLTVSPAIAWGVAGLALGCTLTLAGCMHLILDVLVYGHAVYGGDRALAVLASVLGAASGTAFGVCALVCALRGWKAAAAAAEPRGLAVAGTVASAVGLIAWVGAAVMLIAILDPFQ